MRVEFGIERGGRLVGQHQLRVVGQRPGDRNPLALPAGQRPRPVVDPGAEPEPFQHRHPPLAHFGGGVIPGQLHRHLDVLVGGQRLEQIMHLKDEADVAAHPNQRIAGQLRQIVSEHLDASVLHAPQRPDQRQERRLPRPGRAGHHHELPGRHVETDIEQHLIARLAFAVPEIDGFGAQRGGAGNRLDVSQFGHHQNTSAGSARITRRIARAAEIRHMPTVSARLSRVSPNVMCKGSSAIVPITQ